MNEDFEHVLESLELLEEAAYNAEGTANWGKTIKAKPNLDYYAAKFYELRGMIRNLSSEIWSLAQTYDVQAQTQQRKCDERTS